MRDVERQRTNKNADTQTDRKTKNIFKKIEGRYAGLTIKIKRQKKYLQKMFT